MKLKACFILLISLFSFISSCDSNGKSSIRNILMNAKKSLPGLIKEMQESELCKTSKLRPVCAKGFQFWSSAASTRYYRGIDKDEETMNAFYDLLFEDLPIENEDLGRLKDVLSTIEFSGMVNTIGLDLVYNKKTMSSGCFFTIIEENNCKNGNEFDFLYTTISTGFKLEDDLFLLERGEGGLFWSAREEVITHNPSNLSKGMYNTLLNIFQIGSFDSAIQVIDAIPE